MTKVRTTHTDLNPKSLILLPPAVTSRHTWIWPGSRVSRSRVHWPDSRSYLGERSLLLLLLLLLFVLKGHFTSLSHTLHLVIHDMDRRAS